MRSDFLKQTVKTLFSLTAFFCLTGLVFAQESQPLEYQDDNEIAPPPVFSLTSEEKSQLNGESDIKRRTQLCLLLADSRLKRAEDATVREDYQTALTALGSYQAVIENHLDFLQRNNYNAAGKVRENFRRIDITLRAYAPRIETIRRTTPFEFAVHLKSILNFTRDARSRALDSFFSDKILVETAGAGTPRMTQPEPGAGSNSFSKEKKP
jgi:hypothetical protein